MAEPMPAYPQRYTYADLLSWPGDQRWELIEGLAYDMTPAPSRGHEEISVALTSQFYQSFKGKPCRVYSAPFDVRLPQPAEDDMTTSTVVQPDITVVCDRDKLDERGCLGTPTLVVEILSPETRLKDMRTKYHLYERVGVSEYWIISPVDQTLMVFTRDEQGRYSAPTVYHRTDHVPVSVLPGLVIELAEVFANLEV